MREPPTPAEKALAAKLRRNQRLARLAGRWDGVAVSYGSAVLTAQHRGDRDDDRTKNVAPGGGASGGFCATDVMGFGPPGRRR